jgi:8-oxo-dGTP pyrophosphatase MutT (NUDIX family)
VNRPADDPAAVPIRPAATVIVLRDHPGQRLSRLEVLLVRRDAGLAFHGGSWVFPGGRIDAAELTAAGGDEAVAARRAAVREVQEETGLHIMEADLVPFSHWTTPLGRNRRFATHFFVTGAADGTAAVTVDDGEIREFEWFTPVEATARSEAGDIQLAGPTYVSLLRLRPLASVHEALGHARDHPYEVFRPRLVTSPDGRSASVYEGDAAYDSGDLDAPGPRHRMLAHGDSFDYVHMDTGG